MDKRFIKKVAWLLPVPLCIVLANVLVDPAGVFAQRQKREVAQRMLQGYAVVAEGEIDSRQVLRYYARELAEPKDIIALGSSRTMTLSSDFFPGQSFFNASVPAATLRDVLANYQLFHEKALPPKHVVIGVDPHFLNAYADNHLYLPGECRRALQRLDMASFRLADLYPDWMDPRYMQAVSPAYFQVSMYMLPTLLRKGRPQPTFLLDESTPSKMLRADGSLRYELSRRLRNLDDVERRAHRYAVQYPPELLHFDAIHDSARQVFERFVAALRAENIAVTFFLPPYHPTAYAVLVNERSCRILPAVEAYLRGYAETSDIAVLGSYDPAQCGLVAADFYDAVHATPESIIKLFVEEP